MFQWLQTTVMCDDFLCYLRLWLKPINNLTSEVKTDPPWCPIAAQRWSWGHTSASKWAVEARNRAEGGQGAGLVSSRRWPGSCRCDTAPDGRWTSGCSSEMGPRLPSPLSLFPLEPRAFCVVGSVTRGAADRPCVLAPACCPQPGSQLREEKAPLRYVFDRGQTHTPTHTLSGRCLVFWRRNQEQLWDSPSDPASQPKRGPEPRSPGPGDVHST